ncbi:MAG: hypothetical protein ACKVQS_08220 [Fimbriimonadaceae bacterium]
MSKVLTIIQFFDIIIITIMLLPAIAFSNLESQWFRLSRDIKTTQNIQTLGPVQVCGDTELIPSHTEHWIYTKYCTQDGTSGSGSPTWTTPVANTFASQQIDLPVTWGGVNGQLNKVYTLEARFDEFAQYDVVVFNGVPYVSKYTCPAVENWIYAQDPMGGQNGARSRTVKNFQSCEVMNMFRDQVTGSGS